MKDIVDGGDRIADRKRTMIRVATETVVVLAERALILNENCASDCLIQKKERIP